MAIEREAFQRWLQRMVQEKRRQGDEDGVNRFLEYLLDIDGCIEFLEVVAP